MPLSFPQAFPLIAGTRRAAVQWSKPENCRPTSTFTDGETYGMPMGPRNGVWCLDLDRKNGKDGLAEISNYARSIGQELPSTLTTRTPSGGLHVYFRWEDERPVRFRIGILPGVDVPVAAFEGGDYHVLVNAPIADAPQWLVDLVGAREEDPPATSAIAITPDHPEWDHRVIMATAFIAGEPPCISGQGGQKQLWKVCLRLSRTYELPVDTAMDVLRPYNARCVPPWSDAEIRRHLARAAEEGEGITGTFSADSPLLGTPHPKVPPVAEVGDTWRRKHDPVHTYAGTVADVLFGAVAKGVKQTPQELAMKFTGPAAEPAWVGVWQWDMFRRRIVAVNPPFKLDAETTGLTKTDLARIQATLSAAGMVAGLEAIENAIMVAAREAEFHPVRDYLEALPQMTFDDADRYFGPDLATKLWGATDRAALESSHLRRLAIAAVRRIREPGTKVDSMLVLAGEQGLRKSAFCSKLFGEYFLDQVPNLEKDKEASIAIEGYWGIEFAEFRALRASEATKKEFLTRFIDKYRPVWESQVQVFPRQCVFIGTTNDDDFLTDPTGDTRYDICDVREAINIAWLERDRFWAAASVLEASGEPHWRDRAARARKSAECAAEESAGFHAEDPWTATVLKYAQDKKHVTVEECLTLALVVPLDRQDDKTVKRVKAILRRHYGVAKTAWIDGHARRVYRVKTSERADAAS